MFDDDGTPNSRPSVVFVEFTVLMVDELLKMVLLLIPVLVMFVALENEVPKSVVDIVRFMIYLEDLDKSTAWRRRYTAEVESAKNC